MILQALTDYYRVLEQAGKIDAPGWAPVKGPMRCCSRKTAHWSRCLTFRRNSRGERRWFPRRRSSPSPRL